MNLFSKLSYGVAAFLLGISSLYLYGPSGNVGAQTTNLIGCGTGSGIFDLFEGDPAVFQIRGDNANSNVAIRNQGFASFDLSSIAPGTALTEGEYRIYAVAADEHWLFGRNINDASTFESFYVQLGDGGEITPKATPDLGTGFKYNWDNLTPPASNAWPQVNTSNDENFSDDIDWLGSNTRLRNVNENELIVPNVFDLNAGTNVDLGADLGVVSTVGDGLVTEINFHHFFSTNSLSRNAGFTLGQQNVQDYRDGFFNGVGPLSEIRGLPSSVIGENRSRDFSPFMHPDHIFIDNSNSTNVGLVRIECVSEPSTVTPTSPFNLIPTVELSMQTVPPGGSVTVTREVQNIGTGTPGEGVTASTVESQTGTTSPNPINGFTERPIEGDLSGGSTQDFGSQVINIPENAEPGSVFCTELTVSQGSPDSPGVVRSDVECFTVQVDATIRVTGGDVVTGLGLIGSDGAQPSLTASDSGIEVARNSGGGAFSEYGVFGAGGILNGAGFGFGSSGSVNRNSLTFSNSNLSNLGAFGLQQAIEIPGGFADSRSDAQNLPGGFLNFAGRTANQLQTIEVDGNLRINGNLLSEGGNHDPGNPPIFIFAVEGDVYIDPSVAEINAIIWATGTVYTCANTATGYSSVPPAVNECSQPLVINGAVSANNINLGRHGGGIVFDQPSETFNRPAWLDLIEFGSVNGANQGADIDRFRDLPPIISN